MSHCSLCAFADLPRVSGTRDPLTSLRQAADLCDI